MNHLKQNASQAGNFDVCGWALWASARRQRSSETGQSWDDWASISIFANNDAIECQLSPVATISLCCLLPKPVACDSRRERDVKVEAGLPTYPRSAVVLRNLVDGILEDMLVHLQN